MVKPLSFPLRLDLMQKEGILRLVKVNAGQSVIVGSKTYMLVLDGLVYHVTGTASIILFATLTPGTDRLQRTHILAGLATGYYPLFNTASEETQTQAATIILKEKDYINFQGGAGSYVNVNVIEWERP